ncbi:MAG: hypothetical protein US69_C0006G0003 [candidate division TM6 bacterium GW2011_GWF2_38_10]|nr:MAG: hypothetical protein US69_C0006G0003 [candidate division TM6 bacterium GW2011_GWF2_38_10]
MQFFLCIGVCFFSLIGGVEYRSNVIEFTQSEVFIPYNLGDIKLYKDAHGFYILKEGKIHNIAWCFCDQLLQDMSDEELLIFLGRSNFAVIMFTPDEYFQFKQNNFIEIKADEIASRIISKKNNGYIKVNQMDNGTYTLHAQLRLLGGGGILSIWGVGVVATIWIGGPALTINLVGQAMQLGIVLCLDLLKNNTRPTEEPIIPSQNPPDSSDSINDGQQPYVYTYPKLRTLEEIEAEFKANGYVYPICGYVYSISRRLGGLKN